MGYHPRLEPFKFLSAHQGVVGDPTKKKKKTGTTNVSLNSVRGIFVNSTAMGL